jgi:hypothetical protein
MGRWGFIYVHCFFFFFFFPWKVFNRTCVNGLAAFTILSDPAFEAQQIQEQRAALSSRQARLLYTSSIKSHPLPLLTRGRVSCGMTCFVVASFFLFLPPFSFFPDFVR